MQARELVQRFPGCVPEGQERELLQYARISFRILSEHIFVMQLRDGQHITDIRDFLLILQEMEAACGATLEAGEGMLLRRVFDTEKGPCPRCGHVHTGDRECGEPMGGDRICRCELEVPA